MPLGVCVPTSSPNRAVFEHITCLFWAQLVPFSSPDCASFMPKEIFFRAQIVPSSCPNRTPFEPCSCCYRALSCCVHSSTGCSICCAAKLGDFFQQVSFSKHKSLIHGNWHTWEDMFKKIKGEKKRVSERAVHWNRCDEHFIRVVRLDQRKTMSFNGRAKKIYRYLNKLLIYRRV